MMVRIFVPCASDLANGSAFRGSDHNFPVLPSIGHVLRFAGERQGGELTVAKVGFVQDGDAFMAAVWVDGAETALPDPVDEVGDEDRHQYRDLNYDVPPESMTGY